jgi:hypothetical protein
MYLPPANFRSLSSFSIALFFVTLTFNPASAGLITYVDRSGFDAVGPVNLIDFETSSVGSITSGGTLSGITFTYNFGGVNLTVDDQFDTTSGVNYLGTDDGGVLQDGDDLSFSFSPVGGFGIYLISQDLLLDGDFTLTSGTATASLSALSVQQTLGDGSSVWFLGIRSTGADTFSSAMLETHGGGGAFLYNLDDIVTANVTAVPEPSSLVLLMSVAGIFGCRRFLKPLRKRKLK